MAWTAPATYTVGETMTAAIFNTQLRDNTLWLYSYLFSPPMAKSHKSADIGIVTGTWTSTQLDTNDYDTDSISDITSGTFTINTAGVYAIVATCRFDADGAGVGRRMIRIDQSSGSIVSQNEVGQPSTTLECSVMCSGYQQCSTSDTFKVDVYQNTGSNLDIKGTEPPVGYSLAVQWQGQP